MVEFERDGGVARIFLNRPQKVNALDSAMLDALAAAIQQVDDGVRVAARGTRFAMPEVRLGIPSVVEAALLPRPMGSGRAAWLVLTGDPAALRTQKELLQIWEEQPLAASVAASIERFSQAYTIGRAKAGKEY